MASRKTVGVLLFEGFELLDVFGPLQAWGMLAEITRAYTIVAAAETPGPIRSAQGPRAVADYALADCPPIDVILVPGGIGTRREVNNAALLEWLRRRAAQAEVVTSVCTGAALLACAGLLDGRRATSNKLAFKWVTSQGPAVQWVGQARWVEDGKFTTSSGVSAGIDMALAMIARLVDVNTAEQIAIRMEYEWHRDPSWDPFAKIHGLV
ncbi:MAG TPA: DJ-1/PfpI family protein [Candidatus Binataceae bacterium]|jgi:transcriptional regulator GlxA family with amidase domain|nr:DJ-1/PfpI family protein [Candidatus Binataceae bacterium]